MVWLVHMRCCFIQKQKVISMIHISWIEWIRRHAKWMISVGHLIHGGQCGVVNLDEQFGFAFGTHLQVLEIVHLFTVKQKYIQMTITWHSNLIDQDQFKRQILRLDARHIHVEFVRKMSPYNWCTKCRTTDACIHTALECIRQAQ